jgi:DNA (cytosine-5)-methyltransferase 1
MARIVCEIRPRNVFVENSPVLTSRGLDRVLGDLAKVGYNAKWGVFSGYEVGCPAPGERIFILATKADCDHGSKAELEFRGNRERQIQSKGAKGDKENPWRKTYSTSCRVVDGMGGRMDRLVALGNGQVPRLAAFAWKELERLSK